MSEHIEVTVDNLLNEASNSFKTSFIAVVEAIKNRFNLDDDEVSECVAETLCADRCSTIKSKPKSPPVSNGTSKKCSGVLKKGGECGKKASHQILDKWYCGVHRPDKPSKARSPLRRAPATKKKPQAKKLPPKKGTIKDNTKLAQERLDRLMQKCVKPANIEIINVNGRNIDRSTRLLFDGNKVYGKLDEDGETILPLEEFDVSKLDAWGVEFKAVPLKLDDDETDGLKTFEREL